MSKILTVTFDGSVLRPDTPLELEPNKRYLITIVSLDNNSSQVTAADAWDVLEDFAGTVDAPDDWASQHDHYLYGTAKRQPDITP